ncbi:MAG: multifunctional nuclease/2',3'-cyclic-nucleotide 2'-phosphodiesterase/5'-nucleotidase/3'-nucleotidase [Microbacterium sp.]|uniref:Endonuclease YhcR n=5 Tax=Bacteria TaxID=2 RepID=A0A0F0LUQ9_9MICO|nr:ExeM/NucH family extracellular endonuclease [Microbacterium ginsengisoli]KJL36833.1 Endonuclease YhcR precursor [Microbacterium ginsengisoli]MAL06592.1 multifunctional nuclease/2',3'-cyclic-nucleotide 2'-phosphodiesterase/5'-nucleotidase/3'-nucleotidase [Microbacterium sp.]MBN9208302.1 ExeM/NucH family extracellular endonuclease [Microbacterium ginsengisoli]
MSISQPRRRALAVIAGASLLIGIAAPGTALAASAAEPAPADVIINEAYLKGGSAGAPFTNKFIELYNAGGTAQDLTGWSLQYRSASGTGAATTVTLSGTINPGSYFLVQAASNGANGVALPTPDQVTSFNPGGQNGVLWLSDQSSPLTLTPGSVVGTPGVVDLLGYGSGNTFETKAAPDAGGNTTPNALTRTGFVDTDDNSTDFTVTTTVTPQNSGSGSTPNPTDSPSASPSPTASSAPTPTTSPTTAPGEITPISAIQGTGDTSPLSGQTVTTRGVVTAAYPTGGFNGFYIQTPGTGGAIDLGTHTASDAVFVFGSAATAKVSVGQYVEVTGSVTEYQGLTEINGTANGTTVLSETAPAPVAAATVAFPATDQQRESLEGMLILPQGDYTVTNTYSTNQYAEIGLATGTTPLITPTEIARPGTAAYAQAVADNAARGVTLDDGASINFLSSANKSIALPYLSDRDITVGAPVTFAKPVVLDYRNSTWKFQPTAQLLAGGDTSFVAIADGRPTSAPNVGGDIQLASFNVLNYFTTTGADYVAAGNTCSFYTDRAGNNVTVNTCSGSGPRGAADAANLKRQQDKIVAAINGLGADVVSLEEIENSSKFGKDRDSALSTLVNALNSALGSEQWSFVPSPAADALLPLDQQDVIRTAFIYKASLVKPVGASVVLNDSAFSNARQPLAQAFTAADGTSAQFIAIVNHFKSKGSGTGADADQGDGQGASNASRVAQAHALVAFADGLKTSVGTDKVFLLGDFNSYSQEDPIKVITDAGYIQQGAEEYTYSFSGQSGSLDHIFASPSAQAAVTGAHVWNINAGESVALEYSRYNYNATDFYRADAFRSSDHDPLVVGVTLSHKIELNLLNINDFHGRIDGNTVAFAGTVEEQRAAYGEGNTLLLSAGDNIGASLFASAVAEDKPTLDVLNALDLAASAVGNHEFDRGYADLSGRVQDAADFPYLGANVYKAGTSEPALPEYTIVDAGGLKVAVIGVITQETPSLVAPGGITGLTFGDPVAAVNRVAAELAGTVDVIVAEYHEGAGAGTPEKATLDQEVAAGGAFADIVTKTSSSVDVIFTGHTHKQYVWDAPVPGVEGKTRPIVQTGNYGENLGQVVLSIDGASHDVLGYTARNIARSTTPAATLISTYPRVAEVNAITNAALASAAAIGNQPKGSVTADITTSYTGGSYVDGKYAGATARDNRAGQSTIGNLVADSLVASLGSADRGGAEIGVVNPGGLRAELFYAPDGTITYAEANAVLPFVNNLWTTSLTGAQFKAVLEEQWQTNADGTIPSRSYLQLGLSKNVSYTFDATAARGSHITGIWIDGKPIDLAASYRIGSFNFLLQGGDNFRTFAQGTNTRDSGLIDRDAWISYLETHQPVSPDFASRSAQVLGAPTTAVSAGDQVSFTVSAIDMTSLGSPLNTTLEYAVAGSAATFTPVAFVNGTATVSFTVPLDAPASTSVVLTSPASGTKVTVPLTVSNGTGLPGTGPGTEVPGTTPPSIIPLPVPDAALTAALEGKISASDTTPSVGDAVKIYVGVEHAGEWVTVWVHSTPVRIGTWFLVDASGYVTVTIPAGVSGAHSLVVQDADGNVIGWQAVTIADPSLAALPRTGGQDLQWLLWAGVLLLGAGAAARMTVRNRRS